jgi:hypothetical protein
MPAATAAKQMRAAWDSIVDGKRFTRPEDALASQALLTSS